MFSPRRMLFPVDFSQPSEAMAPRVAAVARHFHAGVTLMHVLPTNPVDEHRRLAQEDLSAFGWPHFTGISTCQAIVEGDPAQAILRYAREQKTDLIMMPTHGFGVFRRFILGSVTERVLRDAPCPVWTDAHNESQKAASRTTEANAGTDDRLPVKNVVCAVDFSEQSQPALQWAADFAADASARLTIVHAVPRSMPTPELPVDWTPQMEEAAHEQLARLQLAVGTHAETRVITGEVAHAVHDAVADVHGDLLVIGRRPEGAGWTHVMDHAYPIVRNSPCPVVSV